MALNTYPFLTSFGFGGVDQGNGALCEVYPDNTIRIYKKSSASPNRNVYNIVHKHISQSKLATIRAFFANNKYLKFYVYAAETGITTATYDNTGASSTGRHTAMFFGADGSEPQLNWSNNGRCTYDVDVGVVLLD